jgi:hypothetical protein
MALPIKQRSCRLAEPLHHLNGNIKERIAEVANVRPQCCCLLFKMSIPSIQKSVIGGIHLQKLASHTLLMLFDLGEPCEQGQTFTRSFANHFVRFLFGRVLRRGTLACLRRTISSKCRRFYFHILMSNGETKSQRYQGLVVEMLYFVKFYTLGMCWQGDREAPELNERQETCK